MASLDDLCFRQFVRVASALLDDDMSTHVIDGSLTRHSRPPNYLRTNDPSPAPPDCSIEP